MLSKFTFTVEAQQELEQQKANKEECREICKKKALQKANQQAGIATDSKEDFQPWANPSVCHLLWLTQSDNYYNVFTVHLL